MLSLMHCKKQWRLAFAGNICAEELLIGVQQRPVGVCREAVPVVQLVGITTRVLS
jgi:hypothetical protein